MFAAGLLTGAALAMALVLLTALVLIAIALRLVFVRILVAVWHVKLLEWWNRHSHIRAADNAADVGTYRVARGHSESAGVGAGRQPAQAPVWPADPRKV